MLQFFGPKQNSLFMFFRYHISALGTLTLIAGFMKFHRVATCIERAIISATSASGNLAEEIVPEEGH